MKRKVICMLLRKSTFFLGILTLLFTITLCFPWAAVAQFSERRRIPVSSNQPEAYLPQDFAVYGRACAGYPPVDNLSAECDVQEMARTTLDSQRCNVSTDTKLRLGIRKITDAERRTLGSAGRLSCSQQTLHARYDLV